MLNNFRLGVKIGIQLALLIIIMLGLGVIAAVRMKNVSDQSEILGNEYIPEVSIMSELEKSVLMTMYHMRAYGLTEKKSYYEKGSRHLDAVKKHTEDAKKISAASVHLKMLEISAGNIEKSLSSYETLVGETVQQIDEITKNRRILDETALAFMKQCHEYLNAQTESLGKEFSEERETEKLQERLQKIVSINKNIDLLNEMRVAAFRAQALRDPEFVSRALADFDKMNGEFAKIRKITFQEEHQKILEETETASGAYRNAMLRIVENMQVLDTLGKKRNETAAGLLAESSKILSAGMENTGKIARETVDSLSSALKIILIGLLFCLLFGIVLAFIITRSITGPIRMVMEMAEIMADGDMTRRLSIDYKNEIGQMAFSLNNMSDSLEKNFSEVADITKQLAEAADQLSDASQSLSQGASEQASSLEELSSTMVEIEAQTKSNAEYASRGNQSVSDLKKMAEKGTEQMKEMMTAMEEMDDAGKSISDIIDVIDDIASQTNLLALNATIEAASAGDAGRGFAVVANEIKELAVQSAAAARETAELIRNSIRKVEKGSEISVQTSEVFNRIAEGAIENARMMDEIAASTAEQSQSVFQVSEALEQIDQVTQTNTANAEETASAAEELRGQSGKLRQVISRFRLSEIYGREAEMPEIKKDLPPKVRVVKSGRKNFYPSAKNTIPFDADDENFESY